MKRFERTPSGILVHHSLTDDGDVLNNTAAIDRWHVEHNGWHDIGYHGLIEQIDNRPQYVYGRNIIYQGAHEPDVNATHLGLCIVGNFDQYSPSEELLDMAFRTILGWMVTFEIRPENVGYHSDYSHKSCPGRKFPKTGFLLSLHDAHDKLRR